MYSVLISAKRDDAAAALVSGDMAAVATLEANTVDTVKLASLAFILEGKALEDEAVIAYVKSFVEMGGQGEDGPWLYVIPKELRDGLASMDAERIKGTAEDWAQTEEAQMDRWEVEATEKFLRDLTTFAAAARRQEFDLLLLESL